MNLITKIKHYIDTIITSLLFSYYHIISQCKSDKITRNDLKRFFKGR